MVVCVPAMRSNIGSLRRCVFRCLATLLLVSLCSMDSFISCNSRLQTSGLPRQGALSARAATDSETAKGPSDMGKDADKPLSYYAGMLTNPPSEEDSEKDMITPTLKFVGYGAVFGLAYLALFIGLNSGAP